MNEKPQIKYEIEIEPDDLPIEGNALASGDPEADRAAEREIYAQLQRGNVAAWAIVKVTARIDVGEHTFRGWAVLGGCSYASETELRRAVVEEFDLMAEARADLIARISEASVRGDVAKELLRGLA